eukprot:SAG31_NODE_3345_length_4377_cov_3.568256_5_plen_75_part_00
MDGSDIGDESVARPVVGCGLVWPPWPGENGASSGSRPLPWVFFTHNGKLVGIVHAGACNAQLSDQMGTGTCMFA